MTILPISPSRILPIRHDLMDQNHLAIDELSNPDLTLDGDEDNDMFDSEPEIAASHSF